MQHKYFAASNSAEGFKNYYPAVFERANKLYVIKGGPGTGKSGFMKKATLAAEAKGYAVEYYACSSDPSSLDGVLIFTGKESIGIIDGTSPHVWEPKCPGAGEEIINLGQFWDSTLLHKQKNEIYTLARKKSNAYSRAYDYLRSCGNLRAVADSLLRPVVDHEKLKTAAERSSRLTGLPKGNLTVIPVVTEAVGMTGRVKLHSFEENAKVIYRVGWLYGIGQLYLNTLADSLKGREAVARFSYDPVCPTHLDGIFLEDNQTAFLLTEHESGEENDHFINPKRFADAERLRQVRSELRYAKRLYDNCIEGALHALSEVKVYHFLLEDIYKNAMNFDALSRFRNDFIANNI